MSGYTTRLVSYYTQTYMQRYMHTNIYRFTDTSYSFRYISYVTIYLYIIMSGKLCFMIFVEKL